MHLREEGYDCDGNCLNDADGDGVCDEFEVAGCTDAAACNYNADATDEDGSCTYAEEGYDCDGNCLNDMDGDGVCDEFEVAGCTMLKVTTTPTQRTTTVLAPTLMQATTATATA